MVKQLLFQLKRAELSFLFFLKFCKLIEAPDALEGGRPGGIAPMEMWPHILVTIKALLTHRFIVILKSRQIGLSWLLAAYSLWKTYKYGTKVVLLSRGQDEAKELLSKVKRIYALLPPHLRYTVGRDSTEEIYFPELESSIKALPATISAGVGLQATLVVADEWELHPYAEQNFGHIKPIIDMGGQFVGCFTVNKKTPVTFAKTMYKEARNGNNSFLPLFFDYKCRPGRDEEWYERTKADLPPSILEGLTPEVFMAQAYPRTEQEALSVEGTLAAFSHKSLDRLQSRTLPSISELVTEAKLDPNIVHIYKPFVIGEYYNAATDTSHGVGKDYSVTTVYNCITSEVVADIMSSVISPEELAWTSYQLLKLYGFPEWWIEVNDWGRSTVNKAVELNYPFLGLDDKGEPGFNTQKDNRFLFWTGLIPAINNMQITIFNDLGLRQFYDVIRNPDKGGKIEAPEPLHDDYPMCVGINWFNRKSVLSEQAVYPQVMIGGRHG